MAVDLSVELKTPRGPLILKNPLMPGSSELAVDEETVRRCIENECGAVVTKSIGNQSSTEMVKTTSKPWAFPLDKFGPEYQGGWLLQAVFFQPENTPEKVVERRVPKWKKMCSDAGVPLIVSICDESEDTWSYLAKLVEDARLRDVRGHVSRESGDLLSRRYANRGAYLGQRRYGGGLQEEAARRLLARLTAQLEFRPAGGRPREGSVPAGRTMAGVDAPRARASTQPRPPSCRSGRARPIGRDGHALEYDGRWQSPRAVVITAGSDCTCVVDPAVIAPAPDLLGPRYR